MVNIKFVGEPKIGQRIYRTAHILCNLDQPTTCNIMVSAAEAAQMLQAHPTWFKMGDNANLETAIKEEEIVNKSLAKILPLVDVLSLNRTKKVLYMTNTIEIPVAKGMKVSELDTLIKSHYKDKELD